MILDDILARTRADLPVRIQARPVAELDAAIARLNRRPRSLAKALRQPGSITCISEFKRKSPSAGWIGEQAHVGETVRAYEAGGAAAFSVLTDGPFFGGSLEDLARARLASELPILRKDFIVDAYQVAEALAEGADALLLIVAALDDGDLKRLLRMTRAVGMEALVEAHDEHEVDRALMAGAEIIGVNNRDLRTFTVDRDLAVRMRKRIPLDHVAVAESGIRNADDVARLRDAGVDAMLVGESLMRAPDTAAALRALLAPPRPQ